MWNYIYRVKGMLNRNYDYSRVNKLLARPVKSFIKTVACYPRLVTKRQYDGFIEDLTHAEKVHVSIIVLEARRSAGLLHALDAVKSFKSPASSSGD